MWSPLVQAIERELVPGRKPVFHVAQVADSNALNMCNHSILLGTGHYAYPIIPLVSQRVAMEASPRQEVLQVREQRCKNFQSPETGLRDGHQMRNSPIPKRGLFEYPMGHLATFSAQLTI